MAAYKPGFLIVRSFASLYTRFLGPADAPIYSIPVAGADAEAVAKKYRGIDREPLEAWSAKDLELGFPNKPFPKQAEQAACLALFELQERGVADNDFIAGVEDARSVYSLLENREEWELVWAAPSGSDAPRPHQSKLFGFEPTWFSGDHFSALCDCMCFPRCHGTDAEGTLFQTHFQRLNEHALFDSAAEAEFLAFYRSHDWTETGEYVIAEIHGLPDQTRQPTNSGS
jgi:hypothetical protein